MPNLDRKNKAIAVKAIPTTINGNICMNDLDGFSIILHIGNIVFVSPREKEGQSRIRKKIQQ